jgi:phosphate-selective porin OprO and OprP
MKFMPSKVRKSNFPTFANPGCRSALLRRTLIRGFLWLVLVGCGTSARAWPWLAADRPDQATSQLLVDGDARPGAQSSPELITADEIKALKARIAALETAQPTPKAEPEKPATTPAPASDNQWTVKLGGHIQTDYILWADTDPAIRGAENYFSFRRLRLVADGTGYGQFDFRLQMTLEPGQGSHENPLASPEVKDAYVSMNDIPGIGRLRIGNFFVPFSLEQVTNDTNNIFNERSIPTQGIFAVDREIGMALYNSTANKNLSWATGVFMDDVNETLKARFDANQGVRLAGRLVWLPYYDEATRGRYLVHTGLGILHTHSHNDTARFRARPQVQRGPVLIDSGNLPAHSYTTGGAELAVVWGATTLQSEAFVSQVNLLSGQTAHAGGAYAHLSYFLTGENRVYERFGQHGAQFGRNKPFENLSITKTRRSWGAWETKVRWSYLDLTDVSAGQYNDLSAGLNWYWSDRTRVMFDWIHPLTTADTVFGATESDLLAIRFDVNW